MSFSLLIRKTTELYRSLCAALCCGENSPAVKMRTEAQNRYARKVTKQAACGCFPSPLSGPPRGSSESKVWHKAANRRSPPGVFLHARIRWDWALPTLKAHGGELRGKSGGGLQVETQMVLHQIVKSRMCHWVWHFASHHCSGNAQNLKWICTVRIVVMLHILPDVGYHTHLGKLSNWGGTQPLLLNMWWQAWFRELSFPFLCFLWALSSIKCPA